MRFDAVVGAFGVAGDDPGHGLVDVATEGLPLVADVFGAVPVPAATVGSRASLGLQLDLVGV